MSDILHSATDAWDVLVSQGGLELDDRDAALADELAARLSGGTISQIPEGATIPPLREVLEHVNIEQLVNALFALVRPYTGMMRDLLEYFTQARVTQGPGQWKLALTSESESLEVDLEHFKEYLKLSGTRCFPLEVPVLDSGQRWRLKEVFDELGSRVPTGYRGTTQTTDSGPWLSAARAAKDDHAVEAPPWLPLPPVMSRMLGRKDGLEDAAAVLTEFASTVQAYLPNRRAISRGVWHLRGEVPDPVWDCLRKDGGITNRRFVFGLFHPENREAIQAFQKVIRETFGDPIGAQGAHEQQGDRRVLALDVSASMRDVLLNKAVQQEISEIARELGITHFAAVDDALRAIEKADCEQIDWLVEQSVSGSTELGAAADALRGPACEVYFLTDEEGVRTLGQRGHRVLEFMERFEELGSRQAKVVSLTA